MLGIRPTLVNTNCSFRCSVLCLQKHFEQYSASNRTTFKHLYRLYLLTYFYTHIVVCFENLCLQNVPRVIFRNFLSQTLEYTNTCYQTALASK